MEKDDLVLTAGPCLNPATFLWKGEADSQNLEHNCLDMVEYQAKVHPGLRDIPLNAGLHLVIGGSSHVIQGKRYNGYAAADGNDHSIRGAGRLPNTWST